MEMFYWNKMHVMRGSINDHSVTHLRILTGYAATLIGHSKLRTSEMLNLFLDMPVIWTDFENPNY